MLETRVVLILGLVVLIAGCDAAKPTRVPDSVGIDFASEYQHPGGGIETGPESDRIQALVRYFGENGVVLEYDGYMWVVRKPTLGERGLKLNLSIWAFPLDASETYMQQVLSSYLQVRILNTPARLAMSSTGVVVLDLDAKVNVTRWNHVDDRLQRLFMEYRPTPDDAGMENHGVEKGR